MKCFCNNLGELCVFNFARLLAPPYTVQTPFHATLHYILKKEVSTQHSPPLSLSPDDAFNKIPLCAGDDAGEVSWTTVTSDLKLYASHSHFVKQTASLQGAHW